MASGLRALASELRTRMDVERWNATGVDGRGQPTGAWAECGVEYVKLEPMGPRLAEMAHQLYELATHRVTMRYRNDITRQGWRLAYQGRTFAVGHVENVDEANHTLVLLCSEALL